MIARGENEVKALYRGERPVTAVYRGEQLVWSGAKPDDGFRGIRGTALYLNPADYNFNQNEIEAAMMADPMFLQTEEDAIRYLAYMSEIGEDPPHIVVNGTFRWLPVQPDGSFSLEVAEPVTSLKIRDFIRDGNPIYTLKVALDISGMTDLSRVFNGCTKLVSLDVSQCDISNATNMNGMFRSCYSLVELKMKGFGSQRDLDISNMLVDCPNLSYESAVYTFVTHSFDRNATGFHALDISMGVFYEFPFADEDTCIRTLIKKGYLL